MRISVFLVTLFTSLIAHGNSTMLEKLEGADFDLTSKIQSSKQLNLDDPFAIQLFASWKSLGRLEQSASDDWIGLILDKQYVLALSLLPSIKEVKMTPLKNAAELYLLYKVGHVQTFLSKWVDLASSSNFLQTDMGIAIDQIVGPGSTQLILENGFYISKDINEKLKKIELVSSKINFSLQAMKALRTGESALDWLGKLDEKNPLRMHLAQSALLHFARDGKLGASGKIIKNVIEPILNKSNSEEELSLYFMTLGRLLYQAGALSESKKYYDLIPESSVYFLNARTEALWGHLREKNYSRTKGELGSLELNIFKDKFYPEAYLVSAMANVMLCQFVESKNAINRFIEANRFWAKEIEKNVGNPDALMITKNIFLNNLEKSKMSLLKEKEKLEKEKFNSDYVHTIDAQLIAIDDSLKKEIQQQWKNRKTILETALYKMKFVKIELISRMRQVEMNMRISQGDEVKVQNAATARNNQLSFPHDGTIWGDDLFHMSATVKNKCITGGLK